MKEPIGGMKQLILEDDKSYSFEELKEAAVKIMKNKQNRNFFETSIIKIENFQDEIYEQFLNKNGEECDVWEFIQKLRTSGYRLKLYILSSSITSMETTAHNKLPSFYDSSILQQTVKNNVISDVQSIVTVSSVSPKVSIADGKENLAGKKSDIISRINTSDVPSCPPPNFFNVL